VGLVLGGEPLVEPGGDVAGVPIALPRVLVETVSAGGGSIIWVDDGGALRVGPASAGARPGPAAFGQGGRSPTLTDAHVVLRRIESARMSGGVRLDANLAERALAPIAQRLDTTLARVALAAIATADATMARALRRVSVQRGVDPRRCVLVAFGGGGPLHACGLAEQIGMSRVLVPPLAGVLSALGLAIAPERRESMASVMRPAESLDRATLLDRMTRLEERAGAVAQGVAHWWARARFAGQGHEVDVSLDRGDDAAALEARFIAVHHERFGFTLERPVEIVSLRCSVTGAPWPLELHRVDHVESVVRGAATVELPDATLHVRDGWTARTLPIGGWMLERGA
jgi:N-methylhydantoinase A